VIIICNYRLYSCQEVCWSGYDTSAGMLELVDWNTDKAFPRRQERCIGVSLLFANVILSGPKTLTLGTINRKQWAQVCPLFL